MAADSGTSGTRPERDFLWLSSYLDGARSVHADFIRQVPRVEGGVFHYTDLSGLKSIATDHDLWLTNALYCNDEAEMKLGNQVARGEIARLRDDPAGSPARKEYLEKLDAALREPPREGVYICCFCEEDDDLSQWRAYGADGNGVSIQIDTNAFVNHTGSHPFGFLAIWNVQYGKARQEEIMRRALEKTFEQFSQLPADQIARKAKDVIDFFIPTFKHEGFAGENEWRMIFVPSPASPVKPRYRARRDMLIPYYSLKDLVLSLGVAKDTWRLPIRKVRIGPSRHRALNRACTQSLLADNGYLCDAVESTTPYRS